MIDEDLKAVSSETIAVFQRSSQKIINQVVELSLEREDDVVQHGEKAEEIIKAGIEFTTKMLESAMAMGEVLLLEDELQWAKDRLPHDKVNMEHVLERFKIYRDVVDELLPEDNAIEVNSYLNWMIQRQKEIIEDSM